MKIDIKNFDPVVVSFSGFLDFESVDQFKNTISKLKFENKLVFDFKDLEFVGSMGIKGFVDSINLFYSKHEGKVSFKGVNSDFKKIFSSYQCHNLIDASNNVD